MGKRVNGLPLLHIRVEVTTVILQVEKVNKSFGELVAVKNVSFKVEKGEILGIAGPNGAGKSTLFNLISGVYRGSGNIIFDNLNINRLRPDQICHRGIARTFQVPVAFSTQSVFRNVEIGAYFGKQGTQRGKGNINEVINFVGLQGKESVVAAGIDLYNKKLTMLAVALATKPKLLLLDEPMGGLSPVESNQFVELMRKINKELGVTIIVIEHLMQVLTEICHRLMILHYGEKICIGPLKEVIEDSKVREIYLA